MKTYQLSKRELEALWEAHKQTRDKHAADRIKAVYSLGMGLSVETVGIALMLSANTLRHYMDNYQQGGIKALLSTFYQENHHYLSEPEEKALDKRLEKITYLRIEDIQTYVKKTYHVDYSRSGLTALLHRLDFVYKKPKTLPQVAPLAEQRRFIRKYRALQHRCGEDDKIYFMDATHPHYQTVAGYGWIKRGQKKSLPLTLSQSVLNINGAIELKQMEGLFMLDTQRITEETILDYLERLRKQQPRGWLYLICDKAGYYYRSKQVKAFAKACAIRFIYLPTRSPHLNIIERLWLFFEKKVLYNRPYESFERFSQACQQFFQRLPTYEKELRSLLTDNFPLVGKT